jgi:hypothetical protein
MDYMAPPSVLRRWETVGGFLVRSGEGTHWRTVESLDDLQPGSQIASYPEIAEQLESGEVSLPDGVEVVSVRPITTEDVESAIVSRSEESAYLDLDGYVCRISTHPPLTARSGRGVILDVRLTGSAIEERWADPDAGYVVTYVDHEAAEAELRLAALAWLMRDATP